MLQHTWIKYVYVIAKPGSLFVGGAGLQRAAILVGPLIHNCSVVRTKKEDMYQYWRSEQYLDFGRECNKSPMYGG